MKEAQSTNCIGFAYYRLGLTKSDERMGLPPYKDLIKNFVLATEGDEDAIGVISTDNRSATIDDTDIVIHLAVIDPEDRRFVLHRPASNMPVCREPKRKIIDQYKAWSIVNLKVRKQHDAI